ncbi:hypothetical protein ABIC83_002811 [Roseateles asaccharophilus]|uniref:hypothetical protein n=1 Tax=Roseateles asaccharophilus TaxID=582607 RepID=UPI00383871B0
MPGFFSDHYWALKVAITSFNTTEMVPECRRRLLEREPCTDNMGRESAGFLFATQTWNMHGHAEVASLLHSYLDTGALRLDDMSFHPFRIPRVIRFSDGNVLEGLDVETASIPLMPLLRAMIQRNEDAVEAFLEVGALEVTNFSPHSRQALLSLDQRQAAFDDLVQQIFPANTSAQARFAAALMSRTIARSAATEGAVSTPARGTPCAEQAAQETEGRRLRRGHL